MKINDKINKFLYESDQSAEYQAFFKSMLKKFGVSSPADFKDDAKKKEFFAAVEAGWKKENTTNESVDIAKDAKKIAEIAEKVFWDSVKKQTGINTVKMFDRTKQDFEHAVETAITAWIKYNVK